MTTETAKDAQYVLCIDNEGYPVSLERMKLYEVLPDDRSERGLVRVIDESGEDYLYPASRFVPVALAEDRGTLEVAKEHTEAKSLSTLKRDLAIIQQVARDLKKAGNAERYRHIGETLTKAADDIERVIGIKDKAS